jgi:hypothetical protein
MHLEDEPPEPMVLKLPPLSDELAARMYELVQDFLEQYAPQTARDDCSHLSRDVTRGALELKSTSPREFIRSLQHQPAARAVG